MSKYSPSWATPLFVVVLAVTLVVYVLRGLAILSMLPGSVIWALILCTMACGILAALQRLR